MNKLKKLKKILNDMGSVLIAYSGGVDSTFLLKVTKDVLKDSVLAVTARSTTYSEKEVDCAIQQCAIFGVKHIIIKTEELENPEFASNPLNRCYHCKTELFSKLKSIADEKKIKYVADATNYDDVSDYRPGILAAKELGVKSPLKDVGFTKKEIRELSKNMNISTWDKPSMACFASRFPYGTRITKEFLTKISEGEDFLRNLGFREIRVRHYGDTVRIELGFKEMTELFKNGISEKIVDKFKKLGYVYVTLDLQGYRSGSMNEVLK